MRCTLLVLIFLSSFKVSAEDVINLNSSVSFVPSYMEFKEGREHLVDSFVELGFGVSYQVDFSELWRTNYGMGLTVSEPNLKNLKDEIVYSAYASIDFEYQQFNDNIKPFLGLQFQQPLSSGEEIYHNDKLKKTLGLKFYPTDKDYTLHFAVSHVD